MVASASASARSAGSGSKLATCRFADCALPAAGLVTGLGSGAYVLMWGTTRGELPVHAHVGGALIGGLSIGASVLYMTTSDPAPRFQAFGTIATMVVGAPALVLGLHGLVTADAARDAEKPLPPPNSYAASPVAIVDARGKATPGFAVGGVF